MAPPNRRTAKQLLDAATQAARTEALDRSTALRFGVIDSYDSGAGTATVIVAGSTLYDIPCMGVPTAGDPAWLLHTGTAMVCIGPTGLGSGEGGGGGGGGGLTPVYHGTATAAGTFSLPDGTLTAGRRHRILVHAVGSTNILVSGRLRATGTDDSTSGHYGGTRTIWYGGSGAVESNGMGTTQWGALLACGSGQPGYATIELEAASLTEKTLINLQGVSWYNTTGNLTMNWSGRHSEATAYDSMTFICDTGTADWVVDVLQYEETIPTPIVGQSRLWTPESAHSQNDEFRDGTIGSEWVFVDASSAANVTWAEGGDCLSVLLNGGDTAGPTLHAIMKPYALAVGEYVQFHIRHKGWQHNYPAAGLCIADGVTPGAGNQIVPLGIRAAGFTGISQSLFTGYDTRTSYSDNSDDRVWPDYHMRVLRDVSDVWRFYISADGVQWVALGTGPTRTYAMTPTHIGIACTNWGGGATAGAQFSFDYFRVGS